MIGDITSAQAWWNNDGVWVSPRKPGQTEMEYQMRNWYYFVWLCGDHITEQHIHNLDVINWFKGGYPVKSAGHGRQTGEKRKRLWRNIRSSLCRVSICGWIYFKQPVPSSYQAL